MEPRAAEIFETSSWELAKSVSKTVSVLRSFLSRLAPKLTHLVDQLLVILYLPIYMDTMSYGRERKCVTNVTRQGLQYKLIPCSKCGTLKSQNLYAALSS
eukprot:1742014-Rhodomonas_salina.1